MDTEYSKSTAVPPSSIDGWPTPDSKYASKHDQSLAQLANGEKTGRE
jgi:hypothetical protein